RAQDAALDMPAWRDRLRSEQDAFVARWAGQGSMRVMASIQMVMNAVVLEMDPALLERMQSDPDVVRITPGARYELTLLGVVPYGGATALREAMGMRAGLDGKGVRVAVLDSGIDYTHTAFGGEGTEAAYKAAIADKTRPVGFPTAKVVGGIDFT